MATVIVLCPFAMSFCVLWSSFDKLEEIWSFRYPFALNDIYTYIGGVWPRMDISQRKHVVHIQSTGVR